MSPAKIDRKWHHDWRVYLAFFGVTSFGGLVSQAQNLVAQAQNMIGYLATPAIKKADSTAQVNMRTMVREFADTVSARQSRGQKEVMVELEKVREVVERMPGAKRAGEQIRREREARRTVWNGLKGETP